MNYYILIVFPPLYLFNKSKLADYISNLIQIFENNFGHKELEITFKKQ